MRRLLPVLLLATSALAQPSEKLTVTATREPPGLAAEHFVQRFTVPSPIIGKLARWDAGICPVTVGLGARFAAYVTGRVRAVANDVGAPVDAKAGCTPNVEIVFTTTPQALADGIRKDHPLYLGHAASAVQRDALAKVSHPVQAWYTTAIRDLRGNLIWDSPRMAGSATEIRIPVDPSGYMNLSSAIAADSVTGGRLKDGLRAILYHVIIVVEPARVRDYEVGTLADYIALLALAQVTPLDACQPLGSIINLLARDCANAPGGLTESDLGFLKGLYRMSAEGNLRMQQDAIVQAIRDEQPK